MQPAPDPAGDAPIPLDVAVAEQDVRRSLGYPEGRLPAPRTSRRIQELLAAAPAWVRAAGVYRVLPAEEAAALGMNGHEPHGGRQIVLGLVTLGPALDDEIARRLDADDATGALLLEAIGSAGAEQAAERLCALVTRARVDLSGCRVSPGYAGWPLEAQRAVFARLPHAVLGVRLLPSLLMVPRKSVSFALRLDARGLPAAGLAGCARCPHVRCLFRREETGTTGGGSTE